MIKKPRVIVIGFDYGTWNSIKPLVKQRKLPTIEKLVKYVTYEELESSTPFYTFPAWKCYLIGKNPGKFGVYGFMSTDIEKRGTTFNHSISFKTKELWDHLNDYRIEYGVIGMPTTHPPKKINSFMVSELAVEDSDYIHLKELEKELRKNFNFA